LQEVSSHKQIEHLYITLIKRLDKENLTKELPNETALVLGRLYKTYPFLLKP
jgi:hypothetical protein